MRNGDKSFIVTFEFLEPALQALPFAGQITSPFGLCQFELGFYNQKDLFNTKLQRSKASDNLHVSS